MKKQLVLFCFLVLLPLNSILGQNKIQIKLTRQTAQQLQQRALPAAVSPGPLNVGITPFDAVNTRYHATTIRPLFVVGGRFEQRQRAFGLDLWYEIEIAQKASVSLAVKAYADLDEIDLAEPTYDIKPMDASTNDPYFPLQWHYHNTGQVGTAGVDIRLPGAWDLTTGHATVIVSVVDGGIDYTHEDLAANMWPGIGRNFVSGGNITPQAHGTHVAGIIGAVTNNGKGVAGIAGGDGSGNGVRLMSCQIFEGSKGATAGAAIAWGADHGAVISQNSWGYQRENVFNQADKEGIAYFIQYAGKDENGQPLPDTPMTGGIVIFAAGNEDNSSDRTYPAAWPEVISVAAVSPYGKRAYYSNYGATVDISAPGGDAEIDSRSIFSTLPNNTYGYMQGTSMACPHVSGVAALVLSRFGSSTYTPDMLRERLLLSVTPLTNDPATAPRMGAGLIDATMAVADPVPVTGITLSPQTADAYVARTTTVAAAIAPANAWNKRYQWSSRNTQIATVDVHGTITGVAEGQVFVVARTHEGGFSDSCLITVHPVNATGITVNPSTFTLINNNRQQLYAVIEPADATDKTVQWISRNPDVATVDPNGIVTGKNIGATVVVAVTRNGTLADSCVLDVVQPVTGIAITPNRKKVLVHTSLPLTAVVTPENAYNKNVLWYADKASIATVDDNGLVKTHTAGTTTIHAVTQDGDMNATCTLDVRAHIDAPEGFSPNGDGVNDTFVCTLNQDDSYILKVFDRTGQVYYQSDNYQNTWDGTANTGLHAGRKVPVGTYFYTLSAKSGEVKTGFVVIKY